MPGAFNFMPGCNDTCGCGDCLIDESDFEGAASSDVPGFTDLIGDFSLTGDGAATATADALLRFDTPHLGGPTAPQVAIVTVREASAGISAAVGAVSLVDGSNYLGAEVYIDDDGCDYLRLFKVEGGARTDLGYEQPIWGFDSSTSYELRVCWQPGVTSGSGAPTGTLRAQITGGSGPILTYQNQATVSWEGGEYIGLGVNEGQVWFEGLEFDRIKGTGADANCPNCNTPNTDCAVGSDDFTDPDKTACQWDGGAWDAGNGGQFFTSGYTRFKVHHPTNKPSQAVCVKIRPTESLDVGVAINSVDATHGLAVAYTTTSTTQKIELFRNTTSLGSKTITVAPGTDSKTICICYSEGMLSASIDGSDDFCLDALTYAVSGGYWAALSGTGTWDDFSFSKSYDAEDPEDNCADCPACGPPIECTLCQTETFPEFLKLRFPAGVTENNSWFAGCVDAFGSTPFTKGCPHISGTHIAQFPDESIGCSWVKAWQLPSSDSIDPAPPTPPQAGIAPNNEGLCIYSGVSTHWRMVGPAEEAWDDPGGAAEGTYRIRGHIRGRFDNPTTSAYTGDKVAIWEYSFGPDKPNCLLFHELEVPCVFAAMVDDPVVGAGAISSGCNVPKEPVFVTALPN